jgi:cephalosporin-C deacetylase-like acetyl esterase
MKMKKRQLMLWAVLALAFQVALQAQPRRQMVELMVAPERVGWVYQVNEKVGFVVSVWQNGTPLDQVEIQYRVGPETLEPKEWKTAQVKKGKVTLDGGTLQQPGFIRCWVRTTIEGKEYRGVASAGFNPEKIQPIVQLPSDFDAFWDQAKKVLGAIPLDVKMTLLPERCTEKVDVYHVSIQNFPERARVYGILCMPRAPGKHPAVLRVPGAGIRPYFGDIETAEKGIITLQIGIHGVPVNMEQHVYDHLAAGPLKDYQVFNLQDKDRYYYKRVYLGCIRAVDFIYSLPQFDGERLAVAGGSQGGALAIVTAGLDSRVKWLAAFYPALCDLTGYTANRAGGWPHMFHPDNPNHQTKAEMETAAYYDVVNFARKVKVPGFYSWGFNDNVCPPTSMYAAYNQIQAPRQLLLALETGHWTFPEQQEANNQWLVNQLTGK